ncbi:tRNA (adenosine(37)-N6)-dimethylallyltransferase MiaA [Candidatus Uhrbacteria bacterium CG_4_9_14_3_um_filter_36_7]|uniref:tRNA dimethylallyltransferase n=1 Tax=Candidatus Uhrbacteria bacterium CG_4_9_14_3_um_filter_36_7 TaxID=1975033 RepID=A0A2M7XID7_9BACT|nr:MAG: tRNA (adenosine(37)-N6)-dimethylallyltransferase MiaA [Candidatus Uhrbacteria bacterium CG_4_9_14_3_um_filter_36_7]
MDTYGQTKVIAIVGPTASGKTALAIEIAKKYNGEILCVDSRTIYKGMDIGTAKPKGKWQKYGSLISEEIVHWGLDLVLPDQIYSAGLFKIYATKIIEEIVARGHIPVLVGGTGLWFDVILGNLALPQIEPNIDLRKELEIKNTKDLFNLYKLLDPEGALKIDSNNPRRLIRAIEVCKLSGQPFSKFQKKQNSNYCVLWLGVEVPRNELYNRINTRVEEMIKEGLEEEVEDLVNKYGFDAPGMMGIGYREWVGVWSPKIGVRSQTLSALRFPLSNHINIIEMIQKHTRHYAKRQMTWFKKNKEIYWVKERNKAFRLIEGFLGKE